MRLVSCLLLGLVFAPLLPGCGGGGGGAGGGGGGGGANYTVGGTVSGLTGSGLVLRNNGSDDLPLSASTLFTFATKVAHGAAYAVTVGTQPTNPAQTCVITHGNGTIGGNNVTSVEVDCTIIVSGTFIGVDYGISGDDGSFGITPLDGAGNFTSTSVENNAGTVAAGILDTGTYTVSAGGAIVINSNDGAVSMDGNAIVSADMNTGEQAYIDIGVKQGQTNFTNADLAGTYEVVTYGKSGDSGTLWTLIADGSGNFIGSEVQNNAGVISPSSALTGTYAVAADGALTVRPTVGAPLTGGVSADGNTLVISQLTSGQGPSITVGIKQRQSSFTIADLSGTYTIATQENSGDTGSLWTIAFDGAGNIHGTGTSNDVGTISNITVTGTYSIAADGTLTVSPTASGALTGSVSVDGQKLVLTNLNTGDSPSIWIGVLSAVLDPWGY
jgi:hypothetical protein